MKFMRTYIAPMTMVLLMSTTTLSAASGEGHAHGAPRVAAVAGQEWNNLQSAGLFTAINRDRLETVVAAVRSRGDLESVHAVVSMMQEPVPADQIMANFHKDLSSALGRLRQGQEASAHFTQGTISGIAKTFSPADSAEAIRAGVLGIVATAPISEEAREKVTGYLDGLGARLAGYFQDALGKAAACGSVTSEPLKAQIAYCLVSQVALGDKVIEMQQAGGYAYMHDTMPLKPEVLNPVRNALWQVFVDTGFVTTPIRGDISSFTYDPAAALRDYLEANPGVKDIVIACGSIPTMVEVPYDVPCHEFFGSMHCPQSHAGQVTIALDYRDRPNVFANALMPGLFGLVEKDRIDKVIIEGYSESLTSPESVTALRAALGDLKIFKEGFDRALSPL